MVELSRSAQSRPTCLVSKLGLFLVLLGVLFLSFTFIFSQNLSYLNLTFKGEVGGELFLFQIDADGSFIHLPSSFQSLPDASTIPRTTIYPMHTIGTGDFRLQFRPKLTAIPDISGRSPALQLCDITLRQGALTTLHTPVRFQIAQQNLTRFRNSSLLEFELDSNATKDLPYIDIRISPDCMTSLRHTSQVALYLDIVIILIPFCVALFVAGSIWKSKRSGHE